MPNRKRYLMISLVALAVLVLLGLFYYFLMPKVSVTDEVVAPSESVNRVAEPDAETAIALDGKWQSTDDAKFVRTFSEDGTVVDTYEGEEGATALGMWSFVADPSKEQSELPAVKDAKVLKIQFPEEVLYFALIELTATELELSYLSRGNMLSFTRVQ